jgi:hypothetical protein
MPSTEITDLNALAGGDTLGTHVLYVGIEGSDYKQTMDEHVLALGALGAVASGVATLNAGVTLPLEQLDPDVALYSVLASQTGYIDPRNYGAACDLVHVRDCTIAGGALDTVNSDDADFTADDVGKVIAIQVAGAATKVTTIATYVDENTVTITSAVSGALTDVDMVFFTDDTTALQDSITACGTLGLALLIPAPMGVTGVIDARVSGLKVFGIQGYVNPNFNPTEGMTLGDLPRSSIVTTYGGASVWWDVTETPGHEYSSVAFVAANSAASSTKFMDFANTGTPRPTQNHRFVNTMFGMFFDATGQTTARALNLDGCWHVDFDRSVFFGYDEQVVCAIPTGSGGEGFSNSIAFYGCTFGGYKTRAIRNPGEAFSEYGCRIHRRWWDGVTAPAVQHMIINHLAGDIEVLLDNVWHSDASTGAAATNCIEVLAQDDRATAQGGSITIIGGRAPGGNSSSNFIDLQVNNAIPIYAASVKHHDSVKFVDFNSQTGCRVLLSSIDSATPSSIYAGTPGVGDLTFVEMPRRTIQVQVTDPNGSALTTGDGKAYVTVPEMLDGWVVRHVAAAITTVSSSGAVTVQIHNVTDSVDVLSTALTIDATPDKHSKDATTPAVINTSNDDLAYGDILRIDIDGAGTGAKGLIVEITAEPMNPHLVT